MASSALSLPVFSQRLPVLAIPLPSSQLDAGPHRGLASLWLSCHSRLPASPVSPSTSSPHCPTGAPRVQAEVSLLGAQCGVFPVPEPTPLLGTWRTSRPAGCSPRSMVTGPFRKPRSLVPKESRSARKTGLVPPPFRMDAVLLPAPPFTGFGSHAGGEPTHISASVPRGLRRDDHRIPFHFDHFS